MLIVNKPIISPVIGAMRLKTEIQENIFASLLIDLMTGKAVWLKSEQNLWSNSTRWN
jgi:hypothetical protein